MTAVEQRLVPASPPFWVLTYSKQAPSPFWFTFCADISALISQTTMLECVVPQNGQALFSRSTRRRPGFTSGNHCRHPIRRRQRERDVVSAESSALIVEAAVFLAEPHAGTQND